MFASQAQCFKLSKDFLQVLCRQLSVESYWRISVRCFFRLPTLTLTGQVMMFSKGWRTRGTFSRTGQAGRRAWGLAPDEVRFFYAARRSGPKSSAEAAARFFSIWARSQVLAAAAARSRSTSSWARRLALTIRERNSAMLLQR